MCGNRGYHVLSVQFCYESKTSLINKFYFKKHSLKKNTHFPPNMKQCKLENSPNHKTFCNLLLQLLSRHLYAFWGWHGIQISLKHMTRLTVHFESSCGYLFFTAEDKWMIIVIVSKQKGKITTLKINKTYSSCFFILGKLFCVLKASLQIDCLWIREVVV